MRDLPEVHLSEAARSAIEREREATFPSAREAKLRVKRRLDLARGLHDADAKPPPPPRAPSHRLVRPAVLAITGALLAAGGFAAGRLTAPRPSDAAPPFATASVAGSEAAERPSLPVRTPDAPPRERATTPGGASPAPRPSAGETRETRETSAGDQALAAERALIDRARTALREGRPADTLEAVALHRAQTSGRTGQFTEERDALEVIALARVGLEEEAREAGRRFLSRYPQSAHRAAVERVIRASE